MSSWNELNLLIESDALHEDAILVIDGRVEERDEVGGRSSD